MHAKLMQALADEQLKFLQKSAPDNVSTPEFLKPYVQARTREAQKRDDIAAFTSAETGPLPQLATRRKRHPVRVNQFAVLGMAASVLLLLMMGGLTSLIMLTRSNPASLNRTINSINRPTEVDQKVYTTTTLYPNVTSALPDGKAVYYSAYGSGEGSGQGWMLLQFDRGTQSSRLLLETPSSDPLIVLSASNSWLVWLQYSRPQTISYTASPNHGGHTAPQRSWSLHYLSLLPQPKNAGNPQSQTHGQKATNGQDHGLPAQQKISAASQPAQIDIPVSLTLAQGTFDRNTTPDWVTTPISGSWLIGDTLLVTQIDQQGISHLESYLLGQTGKAAAAQIIASAPAGHVLAWPTANNTGMEIYWADEWVGTDGTLHSNIWQQQTTEQMLRFHGIPEIVDRNTQQIFMGDGMSFQPQVVNGVLFLLSTSEISVSGQGAITPNGTPLPASATDASVLATPRTDPMIYSAPPDASIHGTIWMLPLDGAGRGNTLGSVGQATGFQAGSSYVIWQDSAGFQMYDVQRQSDVTLGNTLNVASLLIVNGNTTLWLNQESAPGSKLTMMTFNWPD
jgi:hypothetical protein